MFVVHKRFSKPPFVNINLQQLKCGFVRIKDASRNCIVLMKFYCPLFPRIVCGEPTVTVRPKTEQNVRRNEQAGGGAYVPRLKSTAQETEFATEVLHRVRVTLAECENEIHIMSVDFEN